MAFEVFSVLLVLSEHLKNVEVVTVEIKLSEKES